MTDESSADSVQNRDAAGVGSGGAMPRSGHALPGRFPACEAHAHIYQHGLAMSLLDVSAVASVEELLQRIAEERARLLQLGRSADVIGHGARPESWSEPRWPSIEELDRACPDGCVAVRCFDVHSLVANSFALKRAEKALSKIRPADGEVVRNEQREPTGVCLEAAAAAVWASLPEPPLDERISIVRRALDDLAKQGFVEVHDMLSEPWLARGLSESHKKHPLPISVRLYAAVDESGGVLASYNESRWDWENDRLCLGGGKIFIDGTLNSRTAWMLAPYTDSPRGKEHGLALLDRERVEACADYCVRLGVPLAAHAIGDAAVRVALDAIETVQRRYGSLEARVPGVDASHRIEHCELIDEADIPRFAQLGVSASVQPTHLLYDIEALRRALPDRLHRVLPLRELIDSGVQPGAGDGARLLFGSDTPVVRPDPGDSLQAAIDRRRVGMDAADAIAPEQAITLEEAQNAFMASDRAIAV